MKLFIYNHKDTGEQYGTEALSVIPEHEIIYSGNKKEFEKLGFKLSQVGGFRRGEKGLIFDQKLKDLNDRKKINPEEKAKEIINNLTLYFDNLAQTDPGAVIAYETEANNLEKAIYNAGRVAKLKKEEINLDFAKYKISQLIAKNGVDENKLIEIKTDLLGVVQ